MKKIFALIIVIALIATLCSCKKINDDIYSSSSSEPHYVSEISSVTSETEESNVSNTESDDTTSNITASTPVDNTSSEPVVDDTSKGKPTNESSKEQTTEGKPKEPINFVPKQWPTLNSDLTMDYENASIVYCNNVFYQDIRYAATSGQSNGVECFAIVTVGDNNEYLNCVSIIDSGNDEHEAFNIYNDRIYYLQYKVQPDSLNGYELFNTVSICSMNLLGEDKRIEKTVDIPFTHIELEISYLNSKYLFFAVTNVFDGVYNVMYRYNTETNELNKLDYKLSAHTSVFSVEERVFVWNSDTQDIYEYDINLKNEKHFCEVDNPYQKDSLVVKLQKNGFLLFHWDRDDKYLLDFAGNRTRL